MGFRDDHVLERYTPAEAEQVTGVGVALQRDWRRRELLPAVASGHARYTAPELAEMILMKDFADRKLGPKALRNMLGAASEPLNRWVEAWTPDAGDFPIEEVVSLENLPPRYLVFSGENAISTGAIDRTLRTLPAGPDRRIAIVCNLQSLAEDLVARLPRPVWRRKDAGRAS